MPSVFDVEGTARQSLREIVADYGAAALDDERLVTSILTDLLAGHPREATLIRAAARLRVAELLRAHAANRIPVGTAVEDVSARLGHEALIETGAARWIVIEYAVALGQLTADGAPVAPGVATLAVPEPPPTVLDTAAASDPRPVVAGPGVPGARRPADPPVPDPPPTTAAPAAPPRPAPDAPSPGAAPLSTRATASPEAAFIRPPVLATVLAVALPLVLGVTLMLVVPASSDPSDYTDRVGDQWCMVLLPMTLTLVAVTAAMRAGWRAWLATAGYAVAVYLVTAVVPLIGDNDSGAGLFHDFNLTGLRESMESGDVGGDLWLLVMSLGLVALAHAVMKRLGLVRRVGLLAYILTPVIALAANAVGRYGYFYVFASLHGDTGDDITSGLITLAVFMNLACVAAILLAFAPRVAGRR